MTPKKLLLIFSLIAMCFPGYARKIIFIPQYQPQSQFAGYYVAQEKGFFAEEGLDVVIRHIGINANETASSLLLKGQAHIGGAQLFQSIQKKSEGKPLVNVFQLTQNLGLCCVSRKPIKSFKDLDGMKISTWSRGYSEICEMLEKVEGIKIEWIPAFNPVNLLIYGAVDAVLVYSYSELIQLEQSLGNFTSENILRFSDDANLNMPEDGLYVTADFLKKNSEIVEKFVRAARRGWDYARENMDEALDISWKYIQENHIVTNRLKQKKMLEEYLRLQVNPRTGKADYESISPEELERLIKLMTENGAISAPVEYKDFVKQ